VKRTFSSMVIIAFTMWLGFSTGTAGAITYSFGDSLSASYGYSAPNNFSASPFATIAATDIGGGVWDYKPAFNNDLFSSSGTGVFIDLLKFSFSFNDIHTSVLEDSTVGGVTLATSTSGDSVRGVKFDFETSFGEVTNNRLSQDDYVHWIISGLPSNIGSRNIFLHENASTKSYSGKYTSVVGVVPEPQSYAMLLAGLGLVGFSARRSMHSNV
jgi:hypothetical protein